ncbi:hypothetical protein [Treponema sp. OMZ 855]|uniref:hypothetical protein n=1 Tax=Treponema sp. OMZ 855 TaxID=1643512 RepID=UPI0020A43497|nr:hypothetical protein [Treponema sp. OMZ 855]UTC50332.1 hypothetical protein E4N65_09625 [Treponema sp. OMZ 855]
MQQSAKSITIRIGRNILSEVFPLTAIIAGSGKTVPFDMMESFADAMVSYTDSALSEKVELYLIFSTQDVE